MAPAKSGDGICTPKELGGNRRARVFFIVYALLHLYYGGACRGVERPAGCLFPVVQTLYVSPPDDLHLTVVISPTEKVNPMSKQFVFQKHPLTAHNIDGQLWFEAADLAAALGYTHVRSITGLYANHTREFVNGMTLIIDSMTNGINNSLRKIKTRIFSLRGVHLIAMLARTATAEEFRKWVLDLIEKESSKQTSVVKRKGAYTKKAELPCGVYHNQSKYNPYRACVWDGNNSVHVGSFPTVDDAVSAIEHHKRTGAVQCLQQARLAPHIDVVAPVFTPSTDSETDLSESKAVAANGKFLMSTGDMLNHIAVLLEAAQLLSCYKHGKDLAWEIITFTQEAAHAARS